MSKYNRILVAVDFSEPSKLALKKAIELAIELKAELVVIHVFKMHARDLTEGGMEDASKIESQAVKELEKKLKEFVEIHLNNEISVLTNIYVGDPYVEINQAAAQTHADMIVMGTHGRTGLAHLVMGSVAENVLRHAEVPVISVRYTD